MSAATFTATVIPFQLSASEDWTAAKFNQGFNPTITVILESSGAEEGGVLVFIDGIWQVSGAPEPADSSVYLGGDGEFHSISALTTPGINLFHYMHFR